MCSKLFGWKATHGANWKCTAASFPACFSGVIASLYRRHISSVSSFGTSL